MSDAHAGTDAGHPASEHVPAAHEGRHEPHEEGAGHDGMHLGGIDWAMWLVGVLGVALGLVVVAAFVMATAGVG